MYFILKGADFSTANLGKITVVEGSVGTGGTTIDPNAKYTLTVTPTPSDATVVLTPEGGSAVTGTTIEVTRGTKVTIELSKTGYVSQTFTTTVYGDKTYPAQIFAESVKTYTLTINPNPASATVVIDGAERKTITVEENSSVSWSVSASGYESQSDVWLATGNETLNITLNAESGGNGETGTYTALPVTRYALGVTSNGTGRVSSNNTKRFSTADDENPNGILIPAGATMTIRGMASGAYPLRMDYLYATGNVTCPVAGSTTPIEGLVGTASNYVSSNYFPLNTDGDDVVEVTNSYGADYYFWFGFAGQTLAETINANEDTFNAYTLEYRIA